MSAPTSAVRVDRRTLIGPEEQCEKKHQHVSLPSTVRIDGRSLVENKDQAKNPFEHLSLHSAVEIDTHADIEKKRYEPSQHLTLRWDRHPSPYPD